MEIKMAASPITEIINEFLEPFECEAKVGLDFAFYSESNTITYSLVLVDKFAQSFENYCKSLFPDVQANIFIWSLLHEVGHRETEDDFDDEEWEEYMEAEGSGLSEQEYYNLPIEYAATAWAGEYIQSHVEEIAELWNKLQFAIKNFYSELNIA